jgi:hypothetical protein
MQFRFNGAGTPTPFSFFTWHNEPQRALAAEYVTTFRNLIRSDGGYWILAGDLNVQAGALQTAMGFTGNSNLELHHYDNSLDYVVSNRNIRNFIRDDGSDDVTRFWRILLSDSLHYALFAQVMFPRLR